MRLSVAFCMSLLCGTSAFAQQKMDAAGSSGRSWDGIYLGVSGGYGWSTTSGYGKNGLGLANFQEPQFISSSGDAGLYGFQVGFNRQAGPVVFGVEADLTFGGTSSRGNTLGSATLPSFSALRYDEFGSAQAQIDWFGTVRGRVGFAITETTLLYGTVGLAYGRVTASAIELGQATISSPYSVANEAFPTPSTSRTQLGWVIGAGAETMITTNVTARIEAMYAAFGSYDINSPIFASLDSVPDHIYSGELALALARVGLNYKF